MDKERLKQIIEQVVIIVEGRDDTRRLKDVFGRSINTIETGGSAIPESSLSIIREVSLNSPILIFTDPDVQGERIRRIVSDFLTHQTGEKDIVVYHAFLRRQEAVGKKAHQSLGVEHASDIAICQALTQALEGYVQEPISKDKPEGGQFATAKDIRELGLVGAADSKVKRQLLGEKLRIGYVNGKHFADRLALAGITRKILYDALLSLETTVETTNNSENLSDVDKQTTASSLLKEETHEG